PPLPTDGPDEVVRASAAFNSMQADIRAFVAERTRILAAISHDLQTPITRLRLRAEMIDEPVLRERVGSDLDSMQALIREGLDYARSQEAHESVRPIDLNALLSTLCDEAEELGYSASLSGHAGSPWHGLPNGLRRALWNLVDNGLKFGDRVDIAIEESTEHFEILIADHGPGVPPDELEKVFEPFYRLESSRNRETGGTGLGLAIARNLLRVQGGEVHLANRRDASGLEARVKLPKQRPPS
ncbi:MAG: two-component sensor histidine kinase, partial [Zoogloea sp.]|nr:two-component sensor histidine kinase [Zoogloea sp.]